MTCFGVALLLCCLALVIPCVSDSLLQWFLFSLMRPSFVGRCLASMMPWVNDVLVASMMPCFDDVLLQYFLALMIPWVNDVLLASMMSYCNNALLWWCLALMMPCFNDALTRWCLVSMMPFFWWYLPSMMCVFLKTNECNFNKKLAPFWVAGAIRRKFITSKWILFPKRSALIAAVPH